MTHTGIKECAKNLADSISKKGITDERIIDAINTIPRHLFLDSSFLEYAYEDKPFPIGSGQTISQPYTVAFQSQLLDVKKGQKILEIGTGSGYQACVLEEMGAKVFSIERQKKLFVRTKAFLNKLGYKAKLFYGDGNKGLQAFAPFDRILITAAAPDIAQALIKQLKPGGILVVPLGKGDVQSMMKVTKDKEGEITSENYGAFKFVPLLKDKAND